MELSHWRVTANGLHRSITFRSFSELTAFLARLGPIADALDHHPDLTIHSAVVLELQVITHDIQRITERDVELATQIDGLLADY